MNSERSNSLDIKWLKSDFPGLSESAPLREDITFIQYLLKLVGDSHIHGKWEHHRTHQRISWEEYITCKENKVKE